MSFLNSIQNIDDKLMSYIPSIRHKSLNRLFYVLSMSGYAYSWFALFIILLVTNYFKFYFLPQQQLLFYCLFAPGAAWISGIFIKKLFNRDRPNVSGVNKLDNIVTDKSFPSSHTSAAVAFALALYLFGHPLWLVISIWAFWVSYSRYYVAVHYPSDILAGAGLGAICAILLYSF